MKEVNSGEIPAVLLFSMNDTLVAGFLFSLAAVILIPI
jgi:hypothetical protein